MTSSQLIANALWLGPPNGAAVATCIYFRCYGCDAENVNRPLAVHVVRSEPKMRMHRGPDGEVVRIETEWFHTEMGEVACLRCRQVVRFEIVGRSWKPWSLGTGVVQAMPGKWREVEDTGPKEGDQ